MNQAPFKALIAAALLVTLSACSGDTGRILGLDKQVPDEFAVVSRAPLTLPPDYGLRPPDPHGARSQDLKPRETARQAVFGNNLAVARQRAVAQARQQGATPGDIALLEQTGALQADREIRLIVEQESAALAKEQESFVDDLIFWREERPSGDIVDADAETRRLQENSALGESVTEGDTPTIQREGEKSFIEWPF